MLRGVLLVAVGLLLACNDPGFRCERDDQCGSEAEGARCEANSFCSFPDATCESGRRYGELAGGGLANLCVPSSGATSTGSSTTSIASSTGTSDAASSSTAATNSAGSETTSTPDPSTSSGSTSSSSSSAGDSTTGEASSSSTGDPGLAWQPCETDDDCVAQCILLAEASVCARPCANVRDCPDPPVGGTVQCVDAENGESICVLGCQDAMCPAIMVCADTGLSTPVCLWP